MVTEIRLNTEQYDIDWDDDFVHGRADGRDLIISTATGNDVHNSAEAQVIFHDFNIKQWERLIEIANEAIESIRAEMSKNETNAKNE